MASDTILQALAVTAEICGANISDGAARIILADISEYAEADVMNALVRMRREHEGRFTLAAILKFINQAKSERMATTVTCCECRSPAITGGRCQHHADYHTEYMNRRTA